MLENFLFCLNATMPIFLLMVLGYIFKRLEIISGQFIKEMNTFVFKIALPVLVFTELYSEDFKDTWDTGFVLFCFGVTLACILILLALVYIFKVEDKAEFIQASFRSSAALLGVGIVENLYGDAGFVPLMIVGAVPLYNITAVILLTLMKKNADEGNAVGDGKGTGTGKNKKFTKELLGKTLLGIVKNPIIIGIVIGFAWSLLKLPNPKIFAKTVKYVGNTATPLGLIALGGSLEFGNLGKKYRSVIVATLFKLVIFCAAFLPLAIALGYRTDKLIAILIMLGSPTTVSCFVMARSMGHEGQTSAGVVMLTTLMSAFTLTGWLFVLRMSGLI